MAERLCTCVGCSNTADQGPKCWPCWADEKDHGRCKHDEANTSMVKASMRFSAAAYSYNGPFA